MASAVVKSLMERHIIKDGARPNNLFQLLALLPNDGLGARVYPETWTARGGDKNIQSYYTITNVCLTPGYTQGVVCGKQTIQGKQQDQLPQPIDHKLAYSKSWRMISE